MNINWAIRFTLKNKTFLARLSLAIFVPILTYFGIKFQDLTTWGAVIDIFVKAINNPFVVLFTIGNVLNVIPDPTTKGLGDSDQALGYKEPNGGV